MGTGFNETALAVFTTLAPMGACAFIVLAAACHAGTFDDEGRASAIDRWSFMPLVVTVLGFIGATFHLANPMNGIYVFSGVGTSPLSNEVTVGIVFVVVALAYCVAAVAGKLGAAARKAWLDVVAVLAVAFALFCGFAYLIDTVPTWNTPATVAQMLGFGLLGGAVLGQLTLACAAGSEAPESVGFTRVMALAGLALGVVGNAAQNALAAGMSNAWGAAIDLVPVAWGLLALFAACGAFGCYVIWKRPTRQMLVLAAVLFAVSVFLARIGFYGLFMSVAL